MNKNINNKVTEATGETVDKVIYWAICKATFWEVHAVTRNVNWVATWMTSNMATYVATGEFLNEL